MWLLTLHKWIKYLAKKKMINYQSQVLSRAARIFSLSSTALGFETHEEGRIPPTVRAMKNALSRLMLLRTERVVLKFSIYSKVKIC